MLTSQQRREITNREIRNARREIAMKNDGTIAPKGKLSFYQRNAALGIGRKRAMEIIDSLAA